MTYSQAGHLLGRPPIPDDDRRSQVIRFRATGAEAEAVKQAAAARGMTVTAYLWSLLAEDMTTETENA